MLAIAVPRDPPMATLRSRSTAITAKQACRTTRAWFTKPHPSPRPASDRPAPACARPAPVSASSWWSSSSSLPATLWAARFSLDLDQPDRVTPPAPAPTASPATPLPVEYTLHDAVLDRPARGRGPVRHADLGVDVLDVVLGGPRRDEQLAPRSRRRSARRRRGGAPRSRAGSGRPAGRCACRGAGVAARDVDLLRGRTRRRRRGRAPRPPPISSAGRVAPELRGEPVAEVGQLGDVVEARRLARHRAEEHRPRARAGRAARTAPARWPA